MNQADIYFKETVNKILKNGHKRMDRTGTGTIGIFGEQLKFQIKDNFPLLSLRKIHTKSVIHEMLWFLGAYDEKYEYFGNTNIRYLLDNGVTFWSEWPYKEYIKKMKYRPELPLLNIKEFEQKIKIDDDFALEFGGIGPGYGHQWKNWGGKTEEEIIRELGKPDSLLIKKTEGINQVDTILERLQKDPDSRRIILETWNVEDIKDMLLPPCHKTIHLNTYKMSEKERLQEFNKWLKDNNIEGVFTLDEATRLYNFPTRKLSMLLYQRSCDFGLGWPFNIAEYSLLLHMIAQVVNMIPNEFVWTGGDVHIYNNHIDQLKEIIERESFDSSNLKLNKDIKNIYDFRYEDIVIENYKSHPNVKMDVSV